jgi:glycosyltransferase involved in cell wall biosynthesis
MWLFFGGVRPYKNVDALLHALREMAPYDPVLVISGAESGYNDLVPGEMLGRTARLAEQIGVTDRIRFLAGEKDLTRTAELFEAADIVPLPYLKNYGSGILLLAITFGNFIVASRTGGMEEYLVHYPRHVLLEGLTLPEVVRGMCFAMEAVCNTPRPTVPPAEFDWTRIATNLLEQLNSNAV